MILLEFTGESVGIFSFFANLLSFAEQDVRKQF